MLREFKAQIEAELDGLKEKLDFGSDVNHLEEEADETEEVANYLGIKKVLDQRLIRIEKALDKIQKGEYGKCEECKEDVEIEVLEQEPDSESCKACKIRSRK